jgi:hypothetical protein
MIWSSLRIVAASVMTLSAVVALPAWQFWVSRMDRIGDDIRAHERGVAGYWEGRGRRAATAG